MDEVETPVLLARKPLRKDTDREGLEYQGSETESESEDLPATQQLDPRPLAGLVVYVDVRSGLDSCENRSEAISHQLDVLGATICCRLTKDTTHVVFKDGKPATREKAEKKDIYLVSPLWLEACKRANDRVSEAKYPVLSREGVGNSPVVLGRIKRFKSLQPKPLEQEIARSLEHSRKRQRVKTAIREDGTSPNRKSKLETTHSKSAEDDSDMTEGGEDSYKLPVVRMPAAIVEEGGSSNLTVTPEVARKKAGEVNPVATSSEGVKQSKWKQKTLVPVNSASTIDKSAPLKPMNKKAGLLQRKAELKKSRVQWRKQTIASSDKENQSTEDKEEELGAGPPKKRKRRSSRGSVFLKQKPTLVCTSIEPQDQEVIYSIIDKLGGFEASKTVCSNTTHLVCGSPRRTVNILAGSLKGCWVLSLDWVWKSLEAGRWVGEDAFEMAHDFPAAQCYRLERLQRPGIPYQPSLFAGVGSVFVASSTQPPPTQLELLLTMGGAKLTGSHRKADVCVGCKAWSEEVKSVSEQWILDSITEHQQLPLEDYLLDCPLSRATSPEL